MKSGERTVTSMVYSKSASTVGILLFVCAVSGCSGSSQAVTPSQIVREAPLAVTRSRTFAYTGKSQPFTVPAGVTHVTIIADGAAGGSTASSQVGGLGGRVYAVVPVQPNETLYVIVGGAPDGVNGGYNGGGNGEYIFSYSGGSGGGGGASDVREASKSLSDRIVVAAGGAGAGFHGYGFPGGSGGSGGARIGAKGADALYYGHGFGGDGGTQTGGGKAGRGGSGCHSGDSNSCKIHGQIGQDGSFGFGAMEAATAVPRVAFPEAAVVAAAAVGTVAAAEDPACRPLA